MNRYARWLALRLLNRKIRKMQKTATKKLLADNNEKYLSRATLIEYIDDPKEYARLRALRRNIRTINKPWQGVFAAEDWTRWPRHEKQIETFPEFVPTERYEAPLTEEDLEWAELTLDEFYERLDAEWHSE